MTPIVEIAFAAAAEEWIAYLDRTPRPHRRGAGTCAGHLRNYAIPFFRERLVCELGGTDLQRLRWNLSLRGASAPLAAAVIGTVREFFDHAVGRHWITVKSNPSRARVVNLTATSRWRTAQHLHRRQPRMPSLGELCHLIRDSEGRARRALHLLILAGLRGNEMRALQCGDYQPDPHASADGKDDKVGWRLEICKAFAGEGTAEVDLAPPKTPAGARFVPVGPELERELGPPAPPERWQDFVLCNDDGRPLTASALTQLVRREQVRLGIGCAVKKDGKTYYPDTYSIRAFRHAFVALLIIHGFGDRDIAQVAGHSSSAVTLRVYAYLLEHADGWMGDGAARDDADTTRRQDLAA